MNVTSVVQVLWVVSRSEKRYINASLSSWKVQRSSSGPLSQLHMDFNVNVTLPCSVCVFILCKLFFFGIQSNPSASRLLQSNSMF